MIVIDAWEPQSHKAALAEAAAAIDVPTSVRRLAVGDYSWLRPNGDLVLVERKTPGDLLNSIAGDRWGRQIPKLVQEATVPILLVEGNLIYRTDAVHHDGRVAEGWTVDQVDGTICVAELAGVLVARCGPGAKAAAARLLGLYRMLGRTDHASLIPKRRLTGIDVEGLAVLVALPGCGPKTARQLLEKYGSAWAALQAIHGKRETGPRADRWRAILGKPFKTAQEAA